MRINLRSYPEYQVYLNYPFGARLEPFANALHFAVVVAGLRPVCAKDFSAPDRSRMAGIDEALSSCRYSIHDLSLSDEPRHNMHLELGMALREAKHRMHRCAFFVRSGQDYRSFSSDLDGFDPKTYHDDISLVVGVYAWLRDVVRDSVFNHQPVVDIKRVYLDFKRDLEQLRGSGENGQANHDEAQELMFRICGSLGWWDWRATRAGKVEFPLVPLAMREETLRPIAK